MRVFVCVCVCACVCVHVCERERGSAGVLATLNEGINISVLHVFSALRRQVYCNHLPFRQEVGMNYGLKIRLKCVCDCMSVSVCVRESVRARVCVWYTFMQVGTCVWGCLFTWKKKGG